MPARIKERLESITKTYSKYTELRYVGQAIFVVIILLISWSGVRAIQSNYALQEQVAKLQQQNVLANLENDNISLQNEYYTSNQYLDLSARENLGLALPGETELLVPDSVALSYTGNEPSANTVISKPAHQSRTQTNFGAWIDFFMHRNNFSTSS